MKSFSYSLPRLLRKKAKVSVARRTKFLFAFFRSEYYEKSDLKIVKKRQVKTYG